MAKKSVIQGVEVSILALIIILAGLIRARINFSGDLIPGINGGYYPLLVRNLLEYGSIRYPDTQLIYWIQAPISLIIKLVTGLKPDDAILLTTRLFDSFVPPLAAIPVFLFARHYLKNSPFKAPYALISAAFSVLYLGFILVLTAEMQKNATGLVFLASFIYTAARIPEGGGVKSVILSGLLLLLTALTHIGCFAVAFLFILIFSAASLIGASRKVRLRALGFILATLGVLVIISFLLLIHDPARLSRVVSFYLNPLRLFEAPYLQVLLSGQQTYFGFLFHNFLLMNILAITGFILILHNRLRLTPSELTLSLSLLTLSLLLSSPLLGMEWALRYYLMAFLPLALASVFVFKSLSANWHRWALLSTLILITGFSVVAGLNGRRLPAIDNDAFSDLRSLRENVIIQPGDLVVARHGLEWWTGWVLHCRTGKEYCLRPADWDKYPNIYLLRQVSGNNDPAQHGTGQFAEFPIPSSAQIVSQNQSFVLYRLMRPAGSEYYPGELPLLQGEITSIGNGEITVRSGGYRQPVILDRNTRFKNCSIQTMKVGMRADVWGKHSPFSLKVKASEIRFY